MKYSLLFGTLLVLALLATACGAAAPSLPTEAGPLATSVVGTAEAALATASPAIGEALETASPAVGEAIGTLSSTAQVPVTGAATIKEEVTDTHGSILVDDANRPLYLYTNDTQNGATSSCTDAECMSEWIPVRTVGMPVAGTGVDQELLGTITGADGTMQVTYNGWPLYYSTSGTANEHGDEGVWFLVTTAGNAATP